jgi:hypothetical protein
LSQAAGGKSSKDAPPGRPGVVDEAVEPVGVVAHRRDERLTALLGGDVGGDAVDLTGTVDGGSEVAELLLGGGDGLRFPGGEQDGRPGAQQPLAEHPADAAGAAGDQDGASGDVEGGGDPGGLVGHACSPAAATAVRT